jgi:hypothetical protein
MNGQKTPLACRSYDRSMRYDLLRASRRQNQRRRWRQLRQWLRGLVLMRLPDLMP